MGNNAYNVILLIFHHISEYKEIGSYCNIVMSSLDDLPQLVSIQSNFPSYNIHAGNK